MSSQIGLIQVNRREIYKPMGERDRAVLNSAQFWVYGWNCILNYKTGDARSLKPLLGDL